MPKELKVLSAEWAAQADVLSSANGTRLACTMCGLYKTCRTPYMRAWLPKSWTGAVLAVIDQPREEDDWTGRPGTGKAGEILYEALAECGFSKRDVAVVSAVRCHPRRDKAPTMRQIRACRPFLVRLLSVSKPKLVLTFGGTALKSVMNSGKPTVSRFRGRRLTFPGLDAPVYATYAPASVLGGALHNRDRIIEDIRHVSQPVLNWPQDGCPSGVLLGLDTEFTDDNVLDIAVADENYATTYPPKDPNLASVLKDCHRPVCHSLVDIDSLVRIGLAKEDWVKGLSVRDSLLLARMADENRGKGGYELENLFLSLYNSRPWKHETEAYSKSDPLKWPTELRQRRCRIDAWAGLMVAKAVWPHVRGPVELAHRIAMTLQRVYHTRAYIDLNAFNAFAAENTRAVKKAGDLVRRVGRSHGMTEFAPHNPGHLRELLYKKLKLVPPDFTKKGLPSVGKNTLKQLLDKHPVIQHALDFSKVRKVQTTYVEGLRERFVRTNDGRAYLRVRTNPLGARTGRRSSGANPLTGDDTQKYINFQNFPKQVRPMIISRWKGGYVADDDYSKLEIILHGRISGEETIVEYFTKSKNGYIEVGKRLFKKEVEEDTADYRATKAVLLGIQYNMSAWELARQLFTAVGVKFSNNWDAHLAHTEKVHAQYLRMFPKLKGYMEEQEYKLRRQGYIDGWLGQRRRLPLMPEPPKSERVAWRIWRRDYKHKVNEAINFPTQWAASLVTGTAMLDVEERLLSRYQLSYTQYHEMLLRGEWPRFALLINEVHDDLVYDLHPDTWKKDADLIYETMRELKTLRSLVPLMKDCPINVGQKVGTAWGLEDVLKR